MSAADNLEQMLLFLRTLRREAAALPLDTDDDEAMVQYNKLQENLAKASNNIGIVLFVLRGRKGRLVPVGSPPSDPKAEPANA